MFNKNTGFIILALCFTALVPLFPSILAAAPEGELITARASQVMYIDPGKRTSDASLHPLIFGTLATLSGDDGSWIPSLAESWENVDPLTWKFNLRRGVRFQNGAPFTSADVKFSYDRVLGKIDKRFRGNRRRVMMKMIESVETPDEYTVIFKTKYPTASFLTIFLYFYVVPKDYVMEIGNREFSRKPIGTGPFKFKELKLGSYVTIEANEDYWNTNPKIGEVGRPKLKTVVGRLLPQPATAIAALKAGEVDAVSVPTDMVADLEKEKRFEIFYSPTPILKYLKIIVNSLAETDPATGKSNPLRDIRVRRALNYALDIDSIIKHFLTGREEPASLIGRNQIGYDPTVPLYPYDPEKAKKLLTEAGYPKGITIPFHYPNAMLIPALEGVWGQWREVGINMVPKPHSVAVHLQGIWKRKSFGLIHLWGGIGPDISDWFRIMIPDGAQQALHLPDKAIQDLFEKQAVEFDPAKRAALHRQINVELIDRAWFINLWSIVGISAVNIDRWVIDRSKMPNSGIPLTYMYPKK